MQPVVWTWMGFFTMFVMLCSMAITWEKQVLPPARYPVPTACINSARIPAGRLTQRRDGRQFGSTWAGRETTRHNSSMSGAGCARGEGHPAARRIRGREKGWHPCVSSKLGGDWAVRRTWPWPMPIHMDGAYRGETRV